MKETKSLADAGLAREIWIAAIWEEGLPELERLDDTRHAWRVRLKIGAGWPALLRKALRYAEWQLRILARFRKKPVKHVNCHALAVLPLGVALKVLTGARLVYDTHELETEKQGCGRLRRVLMRAAERLLVRHADSVIAVNESIARWYERTYGLERVYVVRNIPYGRRAESHGHSLLKAALGIPEADILFIYQGGLGTDRGVELLLDVFARLDGAKHIVFVGYGPLEGLVRERASAHPNIHFHQAVSPEALPEYTASADVGLCIYQNVCLNHYYCLPNKVYEYIMAGLPLIVGDLPEMARLVDEAGCGWKVDVDSGALHSLIESLSRRDIEARRRRALEYRGSIGWHNEEVALLAAHRALGPTLATAP